MFNGKRKSSVAKKIGLFFLVALVVLISRLIYWDIPVEELKLEYANEQSEFMELNGLSVHYRDEGEGYASCIGARHRCLAPHMG
jgi:hypothetical protein